MVLTQRIQKIIVKEVLWKIKEWLNSDKRVKCNRISIIKSLGGKETMRECADISTANHYLYNKMQGE